MSTPVMCEFGTPGIFVKVKDSLRSVVVSLDCASYVGMATTSLLSSYYCLERVISEAGCTRRDRVPFSSCH